MNLIDFHDWIGLRLYLAARDSATDTLGVLTEVYVRLYDCKPDLEDMERRYGEHSKGE